MKKIVLMAVALCSFAMVSAQSANEVTAKYNDAVAAYSSKNWTAALEGFEAVIKGGQDSEDGNILGLVATAKKSIPTCYRMLGTRAAGAKNWDEAIKNLTAAAEKAELWGDSSAKLKANQILAKVYQVQGGEAFIPLVKGFSGGFLFISLQHRQVRRHRDRCGNRWRHLPG